MFSRITAICVFCALFAPCKCFAQAKQSIEKYALLLATAAVLMPLDESIRSAVAAPAYQQSDLLQSGEKVFYVYGQPGVLLIALGTLGTGLAAGSPRLTDIGLHTTEAIAVSGTITWFLKGVAGRLRPNASPDDPHDFTLAGGWTGEGGGSFPSGHATAAFAFAATTSEEISVHYPKASRYATPALYGAATLVGAARVYKQKHWASDVMLGAAVGYISGKLIFKLNHREARR